MKSEKKFLNHIHYFRGFAIINIVMAHVWRLPPEFRNQPGAQLIPPLREVVFHDSTIYFLFISGFLLQYLAPRIKAKKYYKSKLFFVVFPFLFMSLSITFLRFFISKGHGEVSLLSFLTQAMEPIALGNAQVQYWYIPFIVPIFLISPFLLKIPKSIFNKVCFLVCFFPILGTRTGTQIGIGQYIYFLPIYLLGMRAAMDYPEFLSYIKHRFYYLFVIFSMTSVVLLLIYIGFLEIPYCRGIVNVKESLFYFQKISICFMALIFWEKLDNKSIPIMKNLAEYSFGIYFTHTLLFGRIDNLFYGQVVAHFPRFLLPMSIVLAMMTLLVSLLFCIASKNIFGKKSRLLIGA